MIPSIDDGSTLTDPLTELMHHPPDRCNPTDFHFVFVRHTVLIFFHECLMIYRYTTGGSQQMRYMKYTKLENNIFDK